MQVKSITELLRWKIVAKFKYFSLQFNFFEHFLSQRDFPEIWNKLQVTSTSEFNQNQVTLSDVIYACENPRHYLNAT